MTCSIPWSDDKLTLRSFGSVDKDDAALHVSTIFGPLSTDVYVTHYAFTANIVGDDACSVSVSITNGDDIAFREFPNTIAADSFERWMLSGLNILVPAGETVSLIAAGVGQLQSHVALYYYEA
jgi:hypothetical protein